MINGQLYRSSAHRRVLVGARRARRVRARVAHQPARQARQMTWGGAVMFALPWALPSMLLLAWISWDAVTRTVW